MEDPPQASISAVAALDEPTRRRLYDHVVRQPEPVSRDQAGAALELPRTTAAFHLNRLAAAGLLDVVYQRRTGRSGPGAGRPTKLYLRAHQQVTVSLPERRYDLAGRLLAAALDDAERSGESPRPALDRRAHHLGKKLAEATSQAQDNAESLDNVLRILEQHGFAPRTEGTQIILANCPFHTLAQDHPEIVCGMNLSLLDGLLDGLAAAGLHARLNPTPNHCCVVLEPTPAPHA